jgi:Methyltransferase domain
MSFPSAPKVDLMKVELGGITGHCPPGRVTVNLIQPCDICCDIRDVDGYCRDGEVSVFGLSHTLEHIPTHDYLQFLRDLHRKLEPGGHLEIVQTDAGRLLDMVVHGVLSLRAGRLPIFTPADRLRDNPHHQHFNMWSEDLLCEDLQALGYRVESFDAGTWSFDQNDELFPDETQRYHGVPIPNLGIRAFR